MYRMIRYLASIILSEAEGSYNKYGKPMRQQGLYYVYILTNWNHKVMYIRVTNNLQQRIYQHKNKLIDGFTKKYNVHNLVYFETTEDVISAISREKQLKGWYRSKKNRLVSSVNPDWKKLSIEIKMT